MKVTFFEIEPWEKDFLQKALPDAEVLFSSAKAQEDASDDMKQSTMISTFIYSQLDSATLSQFPNLKLIATRSTGYDHIDLAYCRDKGIIVVNVPSYGAHTVAEHTFALILALSRKIITTVDKSRRGMFDNNDLIGSDLAGKTLGVVGTGKIGEKVVRLGQAFEMQVLVYTRHPEEFAGQTNVKAVSLNELYASSDIISLHLPLTDETKHLINMESIQKFKRGSMLINTARGGLVQSEAVLYGLNEGIIKCAGLDVLEEEDVLKEERELLSSEFTKKHDLRATLMDHVLISREDVLYTAHNAFNSHESVQQILQTTVENMQAFLKGTAQNAVS